MKIYRVQTEDGSICHGTGSSLDALTRIDGDIFNEFASTSEVVRVTKLLAPLVPPMIVGVGLNYREHAKESGAPIPEFPVLFMKGPNTIQNPFDPITLPTNLKSTKVDYEAELAIVIGRPCRDANESNALDFVLGYTCANDVSARDWQREWGGSQWVRGKGFDTFCPLGPCIATKDSIPDPQKLGIRSIVNGRTMQDWTTGDMIFSVAKLVAFISADTSLPAGTVILTGTPHGVGMGQDPPLWLKHGDQVQIEIDGIGSLTNAVE